jgi:hypothetical protein
MWTNLGDSDIWWTQIGSPLSSEENEMLADHLEKVGKR